MDLQGKAATIPDSAAVLVNVAKLSELEKALILYRHARAANLDMEAKEVLKSHVKLIVTDGSFTPERIRRFVQESLPALVASVRSGKSKDQMIRQEIHEALRNPTERMVKSYRALPLQHKWVLIGLLEQGHMPDIQSLREGYERLMPDLEKLPFDCVIEELSEAFIKYV
jgi:hypothetical protein